MFDVFYAIDQNRTRLSARTNRRYKSELGQFMTPMCLADFMASMLPFDTEEEIKLLDPGAGIGSLSAAVLSRLEKEKAHLQCHLTAYEFDEELIEQLGENLSHFRSAKITVKCCDFVESATSVSKLTEDGFTHVILNPPYKKIGINSSYRTQLSGVGIESVNLYSGFTALSLSLLRPGGHLVAIIPRSFCNGPYYRAFRNYVLDNAAIRKIHIFESRTKTFSDENILQENVIIHLEKNGAQSEVEVSSSSNTLFGDTKTTMWPFHNVVPQGNKQNFFHIPLTSNANEIALPPTATHSLEDLGIQVSTGPVVDFRVKQFLHKTPNSNTVPLLYPAHFKGGYTAWPKTDFKKFNAIALNRTTQKWLYPSAHYTVVRRFSSKEEQRRIHASVFQPIRAGRSPFVGFENHLNVFHRSKNGLEPEIAFGLAIYLNSGVVDAYFRSFNGHTQVNATDLRHLKYPSIERLKTLGNLQKKQKELHQQAIDQIIKETL